MEDFEDNLPTAGKRYYMSHSEWVDDKYIASEISMLVCASDMEKAREAVLNVLKKRKDRTVVKCRIDYLVVGD